MMMRTVTIYNYDLTPGRKKHYMDVIDELKRFRFRFILTFYRVNHEDRTIKFWSYSKNEWSKLQEALNRPYEEES